MKIRSGFVSNSSSSSFVLLFLSKDNAKGLGESVLLYDNDIPEGRFYCRTVEVILETPLDDND